MRKDQEILETNGWKPQSIGNVTVTSGAARYTCDLTHGWVQQTNAGNWYPTPFREVFAVALSHQVPAVLSAEEFFVDGILAERVRLTPWNWERVKLLRTRRSRRRACQQAFEDAYAADPERFQPMGAEIVQLHPGPQV